MILTASKAQIRATNKYMAKAYDALRIVVPRGRKSDIERYARDHGESVNGVVNRLLARELGMSDDTWRMKATDQNAPPVGEDDAPINFYSPSRVADQTKGL